MALGANLDEIVCADSGGHSLLVSNWTTGRTVPHAFAGRRYFPESSSLKKQSGSKPIVEGLETNDKSNDSPQEYFKFFVEAAFTGNVPSSEDGSDEGKIDETKGVPGKKAEEDYEKGAEGEEKVAKIEESEEDNKSGK
ncbi:hypothetical protein DAPPUDRAFT_115554 [Daphnia pulex]|uniref:Uncharacterized protein n=1 Tax=Daphnia pulex TaxID=6669 RepID=E9HLS4_DAPPU|nr:hypothetical protein DAPPUDRAFT_115554 [Daphnia pulex]|eukprot:EFX67283.1 hypothetical protein DAPPUDRAFT_115554 [Daphnia pulex]